MSTERFDLNNGRQMRDRCSKIQLMGKHTQKGFRGNAKSVRDVVDHIFQDYCVVQCPMGAQVCCSFTAFAKVNQHTLQFHAAAIQLTVDCANNGKRVNVFEFGEEVQRHPSTVAFAQEERETKFDAVVSHNDDLGALRFHVR